VTKPHLALVAPTTVIGTVAHRPPRRQRNAEVRAREYLTDSEVNRLIAAAGKNRYGHRDATMVLVAYRHGLRAGELVRLRWDTIEVGPPVVRSRVTGAALAQARAGSGIAVYLHVGARCAAHARWVS
jgi:type 1 fimbriae regulatory protein FimB/type 1 fimbriae regulatory protein FimE